MRTSRAEPLIAAIIVLALGAAFVIAIGVLSGPDDPPAPSAGPGIGAPPAGATSATVVHVSDGDTIVVDIGGTTERVRYIGLDAPEIAHPEDGTASECGGDDAREENRALVGGHDVALERDTSDRDRFGRLLRHVWVAGADGWYLVGERLIEDGAVEARTYRPDTFRDGAFDDAERRARDAGIGIWGSC